MTNFVSGHNDATVPAAVLDDGHTVDLLQPLVDHTRSTNVREACCASIASPSLVPSATHVQFGDDHGHVVRGQSILAVQIFAHVRECTGSIDGVRIRWPQAIPL